MGNRKREYLVRNARSVFSITLDNPTGVRTAILASRPKECMLPCHAIIYATRPQSSLVSCQDGKLSAEFIHKNRLPWLPNSPIRRVMPSFSRLLCMNLVAPFRVSRVLAIEAVHAGNSGKLLTLYLFRRRYDPYARSSINTYVTVNC